MSTLWNEHPACTATLPNPYAIRPDDASAALAAIRQIRPDALDCRPLGRSAEGREIVLVEIGTGPVSTLAWSQMHGDEPTHTAVLLDLLTFLLRLPDHPTAAAILNHLRFAAIVMLNPDGAQRQTRHNAQGIDINRDALALASPEARLLHDAVEALQPSFAFNLHNHNPRRTVATTGAPAAVALLAPPVDAAGGCPAHRVAAQQIAGWVRQAVEMHAPGMVARYEADYMPRAFGEWVQQQGVATLLIEAGGWSTLPAELLRRLHFVALAAALASIASGDYRRVDVARYTSLPGTGDNDMFDLTVTGAELVLPTGIEPCHADLGINAPGIQLQEDSTLRAATIAEIGDLHLARGKTTVAASGAICTPGRVAWSRTISPTDWPAPDEQQHWLEQGVTSLLGTIDLAVPDERWEQLSAAVVDPPRHPLLQNLGWVATASTWTDLCTTRLATIAPHGVVAVAAVDRELPGAAARLVDAWDIARLSGDDRTPGDTFVHAPLPGRSSIALGHVADLAIVERAAAAENAADAPSCGLRQVIVGGTVVLDRGQFCTAAPGVLLTRRGASRSCK